MLNNTGKLGDEAVGRGITSLRDHCPYYTHKSEILGFYFDVYNY